MPITLLIARNYPLERNQVGSALEVARQLEARGERVEVIAESPDDEEFIQIDSYGHLVHRVCPERAYARKVVRRALKAPLLGFAIRALEKAVELQHLWNRAIARIEVAGHPGDALLLGALRLAPQQPCAPQTVWPACRTVSLICPTYNRVEELIDSIESFLFARAEAARAGIDCEILIVFQNEGTPERVFARRPAWSRAPLRWLRSAPGLPRARNAGARHASGDLLIFVDDDVLLDPHFVQSHLDAANAYPTSAGSAGRVRSRILGERGAMNRAIGQIRLSAFVDTHFDSQTSTAVVPHTAIGANMAFKRKAMQAFFGESWFDERLEGSAHREETTLCVELFRRGGYLLFARQASLLHLEAESGGCENRGALSTQREIHHLSLDYLFFLRFFRDFGPFATFAPLMFLLRDVKTNDHRLRRVYLNARGYLEGFSANRRFQRAASSHTSQ